MQTEILATIVFSGDLDPDPAAAAVALARAGFWVTMMPEKARSQLAHPRDDIMTPLAEIPIILEEYGETYDALSRKLDEAGLIRTAPRQLQFGRSIAFKGPGRLSSAAHSPPDRDNSTSSKSILLPFARRAFLQYCGANVTQAAND